MKDLNSEYKIMLEQIANRNEKAFGQLYDIFWSDLLHHTLKKVRNKQVAEDILHDVFFSIWKRGEDIISIESVPAYLYSAVRYKAFSYYRKSTFQEDDLIVDIEDPEESIEDKIYYRYLLDTVEKEIENLPEKCKEVFKLSRFEYLTNKEISQKLTISESTVENHINKAIRKLRRLTGNNYTFFYFFF